MRGFHTRDILVQGKVAQHLDTGSNILVCMQFSTAGGVYEKTLFLWLGNIWIYNIWMVDRQMDDNGLFIELQHMKTTTIELGANLQGAKIRWCDLEIESWMSSRDPVTRSAGDALKVLFNFMFKTREIHFGFLLMDRRIDRQLDRQKDRRMNAWMNYLSNYNTLETPIEVPG